MDYRLKENKLDIELDKQLRPLTFAEFKGQSQAVENLKVFVQAAKMRGEALDHVLLYGPPGLGKTTLAHIIANELNVNIKVTSGPALERPGDLAGLLTNLEERDVLFIDEIHRLNPAVEEYLYSAMEDYKIDIVLDKGANARTIEIKLAPFTLIGATTRIGLLTKPLLDRFGIRTMMQYYDIETLMQIVERSAKILGLLIEKEAVREIAQRSRGTPRIANRLLRRVRDFAQVKGSGTIDLQITKYALDAMGIDAKGLDEIDNKILRVIIEKFGGGPVGLKTIATAVGEDPGTIEEVFEPYLVMQGFIKVTRRGRIATELAYKHLGIKTQNLNQPKLFD